MCQPGEQGFEQTVSNDTAAAEPKVEQPIGENDTKGSYSLGITRICCLIISAIAIYVLGIFTGHLLDINGVGNSEVTVAPALRGNGGNYTNSTDAEADEDGDANTNTDAAPKLPKVTLGAYYYPWHADDFHVDGYLREYLGHQPLLGEYDDRDPKVIAQHLEWSKRANVGLWVTSWWGPYTREDTTTRLNILKHPDLLDSDHKIALHYETYGRIKKSEDYSLERVEPDMEFICSNYFSHPNYFQIDGKPVLVVYLSRKLEDFGKLPEFINIMRDTAKTICDKEIYIIGDHIFGPASSGAVKDAKVSFDMLDAVTTYDVYGSMSQKVGAKGGYYHEDDVRRYYEVEQKEWKTIVNKQNCAFIPAIAPGYNDLGVRPQENHIPLARSLFGQAPGSLLQLAATSARLLVDSKASNVILINSFNEWHEDSQIEPVAGESTSSPFNMTYGLTYHGYGTLYLDILRHATRD